MKLSVLLPRFQRLLCGVQDSIRFNFFFLYHFRFAFYIVVLMGIGTIVPFILFVCFFIIFFGSPYTWLLAQLCGGWVYGACLRTNRSLPSPRESEGETIKEATRRDKVLCNIIHDSERRKYVRRKSNQIICKIRDVKCAVLTFVIFFSVSRTTAFQFQFCCCMRRIRSLLSLRPAHSFSINISK